MQTSYVAQIVGNYLTDTDGYKPSHPWQYPRDIIGAFSYIEARGVSSEMTTGVEAELLKHLPLHVVEELKRTTTFLKPYTMWFGLHQIIMDTIAKPVTKEMVDEHEKFCASIGTRFWRQDWDYVLVECNGFVPITIRSLPEGTLINCKNVLSTMLCVDRNFVRSMQALETLLLRVWYPVTVASLSYQCKEIIKSYMEITDDNLDTLPYSLVDFGSRGSTSALSAAIGGSGFLAAGFKATDTNVAVYAYRRYYGSKINNTAISASEHSTMSSHGDTLQAEIDAYSQMIDEFGDDYMFACVSDTRNIEVAVRDIWGGVLRDRVLAMKAKLLIRPDSGDPIIWIPRLLNILAEKFGYTTNKKGYKVLNPKVGLIQGDGIELSTISLILNAIKEAGFAISNVTFGMGGGLLQKVNRDSFKFAMKMSAILRTSGNGKWQDVYKSPITDAGKVSKKGIQDCFVINGVPVTKGNLDEDDPFTPSLLGVDYHYEKGMDVPYIRPVNENDIYAATEKSRAYVTEHLVPQPSI